MFVIGREIMVGGQRRAGTHKSCIPVIGEVVGAPSHWTLSGDGQLESFVLKFPHRFETPANMQCIYLAVMLNSEMVDHPSGRRSCGEELAGTRHIHTTGTTRTFQSSTQERCKGLRPRNIRFFHARELR